MRVWLLLSSAVVLTLAGCGKPAAKAPPATPLTVEQWKSLPAETKYEPETFDRLKRGDPALQDDRRWRRFFAEVVVPERKKDLPDPGKR